jgi:hypothetical protein
VVLLVLLGAGCGKLLPQTEELPLDLNLPGLRQVQLPIHRQMAPLPKGPICRVAVLPFVNDTDYPLADVVMAKVFAAELLAAGNYQLIQEGDILKVYQQLRILPGETLAPEDLQVVAARIGAQLLITGIVMEMRENRTGRSGIDPVVGVDVQIRASQSGEALWTTYHRRQGSDYRKTMHFGVLHTVTGLSRQVAEEIINLWSEKGMAQCNVSPRS